VGEPEVMVIGGEALYRALLPRAERLYLTLVDTWIEDGEAFFPPWSATEWREIEREDRARDEANPFNLSFVSLERVTA
jgi:dihydrofolate reductase